MRSTVKWTGAEDGSMGFLAETGSGHTVVLDVAPEHGGQNTGVRPMECLLVGTGGCSGIDVVSILKKARQKVTGLAVVVEGERAETDPKVFTSIHLHFRVEGENLSREVVERAVKLSADKYCSASVMMSKTAEIRHTIEIVER